MASEDDRKVPANTTAQVAADPLAGLVIAFPGGIERQEAAGQRELVTSDVLPSDGSENAAWTKMGVVFGKRVAGDEMFRYVTLPVGWKKQATDHSMWSKLVDGKGRERAAIFYKAAFYDRRANVTVSRRFAIKRSFDDARPDLFQFEVTDCGKQIYATADRPRPDDWEGRAAVDMVLRAECAAWLAERFPRWEDPAEHWD